MKAQFVKRRLVELGKDADWLAGQCEVSPVTMKQHFLKGVRPSAPVLKLMAQALKCSVSDLLLEEEARAG
jgi:hypothetical protein